jgi:hypothetical protein
MDEVLEEARQEIKRADHLIYVSLKYTRTVDVIKNVIERLVNAMTFTIDDLLKYALEKKMIHHIPTAPGLKCDLVREVFDDRKIHDYIEFYLLMRRVKRAEFRREEEFRRHVAMIFAIDGRDAIIDIDVIYEYFEITKDFADYVMAIIRGPQPG